MTRKNTSEVEMFVKPQQHLLLQNPPFCIVFQVDILTRDHGSRIPLCMRSGFRDIVSLYEHQEYRNLIHLQ